MTLDYERLRQLPDGTFGREYVRGMDVNVGKTLCETTNIIWRFYLLKLEKFTAYVLKEALGK